MSSSYCSKTDAEMVWGVDNIDQWATLSSGDDSTVKNARIAAAIGAVSDDLDEVLRCVTEYESRLPITTVPPNVKYKVAIGVGLWLYAPHATDDYAEDAKNYPSARAAEYQRWLDELRNGKRKLDLA